jgi:signal transduction histidine kinase
MGEPAVRASVPQLRLAAIATAASSVASRTSLSSTLEVLAEAVRSSGGVAGVQILTLDDSPERFRVVGAAGFPRTTDFFERLLECRARGATFEMFRAFDERRPVVVPHRSAVMLADPAWEPLHEFLCSPRWDAFASVPMIGRQGPIGVLNVFLSEGVDPKAEDLEFLEAMAEQAALAIEYASLLELERDIVRREERQRLARDLHDSVVQQVFAINMRARSLGLIARKDVAPAPDVIAVVADDIAQVASRTLVDLRGLVDELRPGSLAVATIGDSLMNLARTTSARTGVDVDVEVVDPGQVLPDLPRDLAEDAYRVLAEAVYNAVKHSGGRRILIHAAVSGDASSLRATVTDDGTGGVPAISGEDLARGFGLVAMRERAERWGGTLTVEDASPHGTTVHLEVPLPDPSLADDSHWTVFR